MAAREEVNIRVLLKIALLLGLIASMNVVPAASKYSDEHCSTFFFDSFDVTDLYDQGKRRFQVQVPAGMQSFLFSFKCKKGETFSVQIKPKKNSFSGRLTYGVNAFRLRYSGTPLVSQVPDTCPASVKQYQKTVESFKATSTGSHLVKVGFNIPGTFIVTMDQRCQAATTTTPLPTPSKSTVASTTTTSSSSSSSSTGSSTGSSTSSSSSTSTTTYTTNTITIGSSTSSPTTMSLSSNNSNESIFLLGGDLGDGTLFYNSGSEQLWIEGTLPFNRFYATAAYCSKSNLLYYAGGSPDYRVSDLFSYAYSMDVNSKQTIGFLPMAVKRIEAASICLGDGESFMVTGGHNPAVLSSCEILNPAKNKFFTAAPMLHARTGHAAVLYAGSAVMLGGSNSGQKNLASAEQFDAAQNTWSVFPSMNKARSNFGAAVVQGKIFVGGGYGNTNSSYSQLQSVEFFDGTSWVVLSSTLPSGKRPGCSAVLFQNKFALLGGNGLTTVDVYDPSSDSWSTSVLPNLPTALYVSVAAVSY